MNEKQLEQELKEYLNSEEFKNDCSALTAFYSAFDEELPNEEDIQQEAVNEKRIYFETLYKCMNQGHDWQYYEEEIGGREEKYRSCKRCGKTEEIGIQKE